MTFVFLPCFNDVASTLKVVIVVNIDACVFTEGKVYIWTG